MQLKETTRYFVYIKQLPVRWCVPSTSDMWNSSTAIGGLGLIALYGCEGIWGTI